MRFVPDVWTLGKESFILSGARYLRDWDALAVSGCYWGAPNGVHLVSFAEPMNEEQRYVDVLDCIRGGYDIYEQADFAGFEGNELSLKCFRADALRYENIKNFARALPRMDARSKTTISFKFAKFALKFKDSQNSKI